MTPEQVVHAAEKRLADDAQRQRLAMLAAKIIGAFETNRASGVKALGEQDFAALRARFDSAAAKVRKQTGSL